MFEMAEFLLNWGREIDVSIVCLYLASLMIIGFVSGRKLKNFREFSVSRREFGFLTLFSTIVATLIGGSSTIGLTAKVYSFGVSFCVAYMGFFLQHFCVAIFVAPKVFKFRSALTLGDVMEAFYGKRGRLLIGGSSIIVNAGLAGAQASAIGHVFQFFLGIPYDIGVFIGCGMVILYASFGGIKAVVFTDILQFTIFLLAIPAAFFFGFVKVGGWAPLFASLPQEKISLFGTMNSKEVFSLFLTFFLSGIISPMIMQRVLSAKTQAVAVYSSGSSAVFFLVFCFICCSIGLMAFVLYPEMDPQHTTFRLVGEFPAILKGIAIVGILSIMMSSADSVLNIAAVTLTQDIVKPFLKNFSESKELSLARFSSFGIGLLVVFFALRAYDIIEGLLYAYHFWAPVVFIPLVFGLYGILISKKEFLMCVAVSALATLYWDFALQDVTGINGMPFGTFVHALLFAGFWSVSRVKKRVALGASEATSKNV